MTEKVNLNTMIAIPNISLHALSGSDADKGSSEQKSIASESAAAEDIEAQLDVKDNSGSTYGSSIKQIVESLIKILKQLAAKFISEDSKEQDSDEKVQNNETDDAVQAQDKITSSDENKENIRATLADYTETLIKDFKFDSEWHAQEINNIRNCVDDFINELTSSGEDLSKIDTDTLKSRYFEYVAEFNNEQFLKSQEAMKKIVETRKNQ